VVLLVIAVRGTAGAVRDWRRRSEVVLETGTPASPRRAYLMLLGMTLLNPTTVVYFTALAVGGSSATRPGTLDRAAFVVGAGTASASWQLLLAGGGAVLGYALTSPRGRLVTAGTSSLLISVLALRMLLG
jgi:arginine exporter protein ArgO